MESPHVSNIEEYSPDLWDDNNTTVKADNKDFVWEFLFENNMAGVQFDVEEYDTGMHFVSKAFHNEVMDKKMM